MQKRQFEIIAQDPSVRRNGKVLTAKINLPWEDLDEGPMGYAIYVVDYDASAAAMYQPAVVAPDAEAVEAPSTLKELRENATYHAMNVYAIVMRTLLRFEFALGRRVGWGIHGHQLKVVPHAFEEANAYYSPDLEAVLFGYVLGRQPIFLCLSHDIIAHETAHALLDGLRDKFMAPSSPDQAALHEAFADIVALLSVFSLPEVVENLIKQGIEDDDAPDGFVHKSMLTDVRLKKTALLGLAEDMRADAAEARVNALRRSVDIAPDRNILKRLEFGEEHRRGEVLVAAVMRAFLFAWVERIKDLGDSRNPTGLVGLRRVAEEGADIADILLTMTIRGIDYTPPIHITFGDFLSAILTADTEVRADDSRYKLRTHLLTQMAAYGIDPSSGSDEGRWDPPEIKLIREGSHLGGLQTDPTEMFRHIWNNRKPELLNLDTDAFNRVASVRPCVRVSPDDGFQIRETVVEWVQYLTVTADKLSEYGLRRPRSMPLDVEVPLEAGSTLILDEYGELKYNIRNGLPGPGSSPKARRVWQDRISYLWEGGYLRAPDRSASLGRLDRSASLASFHLRRVFEPALASDEKEAAIRRETEERRAKESWR
jgi:hypothetical protein